MIALKNHIFFGIKLLIVLALGWIALGRINWAEAWLTIRSLPINTIFLALALLAFQYPVSGGRFTEILRLLGAIHLGFVRSLEVALIGAFFSQTFISFVGGDAARVWRVAQLGIPLSLSAKAVTLDRVGGLIGQVLVILCTAPFLPLVIGNAKLGTWNTGLALCTLLGLIATCVLYKARDTLRRRPGFAFIAALMDAGMLIARSARGAFVVSVLSLLLQVTNVLTLYVLAQGMRINISLIECVILMPTVLLISTLPISIAGWGVREGAMITALSFLGIPAHQSLALSVCFGLGLLLVSLPGGVVSFVVKKHDLARPASVRS